MTTQPHGSGIGRHDEDESPDAAAPDAATPGARLDVSPRVRTSTGTGSGGSRKALAIGAVVLLVAALGVVLFNGLNDAALFYYNVDEALAKRDELGDSRFRMQGNVVDGSIKETADGVQFVLAFHDAETEVRHRGDPPELFSPDIPVIIEGHFGEGAFMSDEILIRHDNTYTEEHEDRLREANADADQRARSAG